MRLVRRLLCIIGWHRPRCLVLRSFDGEHFAEQYIRCNSCGRHINYIEYTKYDRHP